MRRDRNSFWHSLFDGGGVPTDYIMVNRPDMILYPFLELGCPSLSGISKILSWADFILNGTLVIHLIPVIADRFFLVYKALSATQIPSNVHCFLNSFSLDTNTLLSSMFPESIFRYSGMSPGCISLLRMCHKRVKMKKLVKSSNKNEVNNITPSDQQQLKAHLKAAAKIIYRNTAPTELKSFETIEKLVCQKMLEEVGSELGSFFFQQYQELKQENPEKSNL
jgi:hypothetical protein